MAPKLIPIKVSPSATHLTVLVSIETPSWAQVGYVRVPLEWLLEDLTRVALDSAYRRHLAGVWDQEGQQAELF